MSLQFFFILLTMSSIVKSQEIIVSGPIYDDVDEKLTLQCHRRVYNYRAVQKDENGKKCWDILSIQACWGRCDTNEIADYVFPFKKSYHPVCLHYGMNKVFVMLRNCEEGALPSTARYEYYEAADCKCQKCVELETRCEGLKDLKPEKGGLRRTIRGNEDYFK